MESPPESSEEWRPLPADEGRGMYEISSRGRVRSWCRGGPGGYRAARPRILKLVPNHHGYLVFTFRKDGKQAALNVHREMARAFHGDPRQGEYARHLDGDTLNNTVANVAWGTPRDNKIDSIRHGTAKAAGHPISFDPRRHRYDSPRTSA